MAARTQYLCAASADGFIADPNGGLQWLYDAAGDPSDEGAAHSELERFMAGVTATCMGAATYEFILAEGSGWPYADRPAWVFTHRDLPVPDGADVRLVEGSPAEVHPEMIEAAGDGVLWLVGGGRLASQLVDHGLLDDLLLTLVPVILGAGIPLFARPVPGKLRLTRTRELPGGLVENSYELPKRSAAGPVGR